jgi:DNA-directed RNA polymerase specialized sigma24 family protein
MTANRKSHMQSSSDGRTRTMSEERDGDDHEALLGQVAAGDQRALEPLYRALRVAVFTVAPSVVRDRSLAEDVLHETLVRVAEKADTYRAGTRPRAWVLAIAHTVAIDAVPRRAREHVLDQWTVAEDESLEALVVTGALMTLEQLERDIVAVHALVGLRKAARSSEAANPGAKRGSASPRSEVPSPGV